jgi:riboflavin synthase
MFTGIVQDQGRVAARTERGGDVELTIEVGNLDPGRLSIGDSIAVNGVCLTVTKRDDRRFSADVSRETLGVTTLAAVAAGDPVNLEPALRAGDALGGHLVSGHVDGVATLLSRRQDARSERYEFEVPAVLARFVAARGSVTLDGVSLTVNEVHNARFGVNVIPHTQAVTTLGRLRPGDRVNLEVDLVARYLDRLARAPWSA